MKYDFNCPPNCQCGNCVSARRDGEIARERMLQKVEEVHNRLTVNPLLASRVLRWLDTQSAGGQVICLPPQANVDVSIHMKEQQ